ncbi:hypothetical protein FOZ60_006712 [Perkinsus olseni]|uniref:Uncharacterized protein n=1 Tax=Perkinsus olseni TaxID=32597 RepID=A0A7J6PFH3_PEROL|nr:hypothetical protein FOZ60_006712 [Perkinsus olseni]
MGLGIAVGSSTFGLNYDRERGVLGTLYQDSSSINKIPDWYGPTSREPAPMLPMPQPLPPRVGPGAQPNDEMLLPRPLKPIPLKPPDGTRELNNHPPLYARPTSLQPLERRPLEDEPLSKRAKIDRGDEGRRQRGWDSKDSASVHARPVQNDDDSSRYARPAVVEERSSSSVQKLDFVAPVETTEDNATEDLFYLKKEPITPAQQRSLLRECLVDVLVMHGKRRADGTRYIAHGELVFTFFDEIVLRGGIKLRDLVPRDEVSQNNLHGLPGIGIEEIEGSCVTYRPTAMDATNRLRCSLKYWEATPAQVELARAAVSYMKRVTGSDVALVHDDVISSRLQLICAAEANGWSVVRVSNGEYRPAADLTRLAMLHEDPVPRYLQVRIPNLTLEVEVHFMTGRDLKTELHRLKNEVDSAEPEMVLLAKAIRRLILRPCRSNEVDAAYISLLMVRSFYVSTAYRGMGLYQDYVDLLCFFAEEKEIGDSMSEWTSSGECLAGEKRGCFGGAFEGMHKGHTASVSLGEYFTSSMRA